jgi:hypothetical protein
MKIRTSGGQSKWRALASVTGLVLLGVLCGCHAEGQKPPPVKPTATGIPMCAERTITITPGDRTNAPTVSPKVCTILPTAPNNTIKWQCQGTGSTCRGWQVMFDDPSVVDTQLFQNGTVTFGEPQDQATFAPRGQVSQQLKNGPIVVKYTVQTVGSPPYDPHIIPMGP